VHWLALEVRAVAAHRWDLSPSRARAVQEELRGRLLATDALGAVRRVAGVDVGFEDSGQTVRAAVVVLDFPRLTLVEQAVRRVPTRFPYVPGLLSFRELPGVLKALSALAQAPDLILCDGQGYAHPRRFGLACHLGVLTDIPTIGVAKTRLLGVYREPGPFKGDWAPLRDGDETIGAVLRTRSGVNPVFVSIGHRLSLPTAVYYTLACTTRYRLPETTRYAHRLASG
jgi:deoxyribonuclease V